MNWIHRDGWKVMFLIGLLLFLWGLAKSQAPPNYKPTEVQMLRLQVKQRDGWLAQRDMLDAQRRYQQAVAELNAEGEAVRRENAWPGTVIFNPDTVSYSEPSKDTTRPSAPGVGGKP